MRNLNNYFFSFFFAIVIILIGTIIYLVISGNLKREKKKKVLSEKFFLKEPREKYAKYFQKRDEYLLSKRVKILTVIIINIVFAMVFFCFYRELIWIVVIIAVISTIFCAIWCKDYHKYFKENVIKEIISEYNSRLKYYPFYGFSKEEYKLCRFKEYFDDYYSEDLIIDEETGFQFADITLQKEERDSDGNTHNVTVYEGSIAKLPIKNTHCNIYLGNTIRSIFGKNDFIEIEFENDEFNKMYRALADNELQAYKILTPDIMEKFVELKRDFFTDLDIRILDNQLYIRFLSGDGFIPSIVNHTREENSIMTSIAVLDEVLKVMQEVKNIIESKNMD